jgi:hypothetical protein
LSPIFHRHSKLAQRPTPVPTACQTFIIVKKDDTFRLVSRTQKLVIPLDDLRTRIAEALQVAVKSYRLPDVGVRLGLAPGTGSEAHSSKRIYVQKRIDTWDEAQLLKLATAVVEEYGSSELADLLSELTTHADHRLSKLTRREILKTTNSLDLLFGDQSSNLYHDLGVIAPRWDVGIYPDRPFHSLKDEVEQHYIRNPDWNNAE